jgi:hypothetical protein
MDNQQLYVHLAERHWEHQNLKNLEPPFLWKKKKHEFLGVQVASIHYQRKFYFPNNICHSFLLQFSSPFFDWPWVN